MSAMQEYQRMAPTMLTDAVMESILWNKVPVSLQQEIKELSVGNVQVLLQKLLRAEQVVQERNRRFNKEQRSQTLAPRRARERPPSQSSDPLPTKAGPETQSDSTRKSDVKKKVGNVYRNGTKESEVF